MSLLHYSKLEPSLADLLVTEYDGPRDADGCFEGEASATFKSGQTYVGSFKGGMMHGRGKYCWKDGTVYTGEFIRNVITGVGKYEWPNGTTYEGTVANGLKHGIGTFTGQYEGANCRYEGEWENGSRHGVGTMYYNASGSCVYRGEWICNKRHGKGEMQYESGNTYSGTWIEDAKSGFGKMVWADRGENYVGEWRADKQNGFGTHVWAAMSTITSSRWIGTQRQMYNRYRGEWQDGLRHGTGTFFYANGARYSGMWVQGMKQGDGVFIQENGALYPGSFVKDRMIKSSKTNQWETDDMQVKPQVHLYLGDLLPVDESLAAGQLNDLQKAILRVNSELKSIYQAYTTSGARCGNSSSLDLGDGIFTMSSKLFWAFCQDIKLVPGVLSIATINAVLLAMRRQHCAVVEAARIRNGTNKNCSEEEACNNSSVLPKTYVDDDVDDVLTARALGTQSAVRPLLFREFVEAVVRIAILVSPKTTVSVSSAFKDFANKYITAYTEHRPMTRQKSENCESAGNQSAVASDAHGETFESMWTAAGQHASVIEFRDIVAKACLGLASSFGTLSLRPVVLLTTKLFSQESKSVIYNSVARAYQQQRGRSDEEAASLLFLSSLEIEMFELAELLARAAILCAEKPLSCNAVDEVISQLTPKMCECASAAAFELDKEAKLCKLTTRSCVELPIEK